MHAIDRWLSATRAIRSARATAAAAAASLAALAPAVLGLEHGLVVRLLRCHPQYHAHAAAAPPLAYVRCRQRRYIQLPLQCRFVSSLPSPSKGGDPSSSTKKAAGSALLEFDNGIGKSSKSIFSILQKLYIWEKKLYEEVKVHDVVISI
ncbi:hypothetical protein Scep_015795 [Stephania cephalantha]|uniref:DUF632 domain-containing protein n=1 Tax=Stephania cephalantha TaxID=152367 RepID=A0AAP0J3V6_9MAGN